MDELSLLGRLVLAALFLSTGWSKWRKFDEHVVIVREYRVLPAFAVEAFARVDLVLEMIVGILLLLGLFQPVAFGLGGLLLLTYTLAIALNLVRGRDEISCGCGGLAGNHRLSWWLVLRNLLLIVVAGSLWQVGSLWASVDALLAGMSFAEAFDLSSLFVTLFTCMLLQMMLLVQYVVAYASRIRGFLNR